MFGGSKGKKKTGNDSLTLRNSVRPTISEPREAKHSANNIDFYLQDDKAKKQEPRKKKSHISRLFGRQKESKTKSPLSSPASPEPLNSKAIFGKELPPVGSDIPQIITACVNFLEKHALDQEGLFRVSANQSVLLIHKKMWDNGHVTDFEEDQQGIRTNEEKAHLVASLMKAYLRELPQPLLMFDRYHLFLSCGTIQDNEQKFIAVSKILQKYPARYYNTVERILGFLHKLTLSSHMNKMTAHNISIVMAPNLIRCQNPRSVEALLNETPIINSIVSWMIGNYPALFSRRNSQAAVLLNQVRQNLNLPMTSPNTPPPEPDDEQNNDSPLTASNTEASRGSYQPTSQNNIPESTSAEAMAKEEESFKQRALWLDQEIQNNYARNQKDLIQNLKKHQEQKKSFNDFFSVLNGPSEGVLQTIFHLEAHPFVEEEMKNKIPLDKLFDLSESSVETDQDNERKSLQEEQIKAKQRQLEEILQKQEEELEIQLQKEHDEILDQLEKEKLNRDLEKRLQAEKKLKEEQQQKVQIEQEKSEQERLEKEQKRKQLLAQLPEKPKNILVVTKDSTTVPTLGPDLLISANSSPNNSFLGTSPIKKKPQTPVKPSNIEPQTPPMAILSHNRNSTESPEPKRSVASSPETSTSDFETPLDPEPLPHPILFKLQQTVEASVQEISKLLEALKEDFKQLLQKNNMNGAVVALKLLKHLKQIQMGEQLSFPVTDRELSQLYSTEVFPPDKEKQDKVGRLETVLHNSILDILDGVDDQLDKIKNARITSEEDITHGLVQINLQVKSIKQVLEQVAASKTKVNSPTSSVSLKENLSKLEKAKETSLSALTKVDKIINTQLHSLDQALYISSVFREIKEIFNLMPQLVHSHKPTFCSKPKSVISNKSDPALLSFYPILAIVVTETKNSIKAQDNLLTESQVLTSIKRLELVKSLLEDVFGIEHVPVERLHMHSTTLSMLDDNNRGSYAPPETDDRGEGLDHTNPEQYKIAKLQMILDQACENLETDMEELRSLFCNSAQLSQIYYIALTLIACQKIVDNPTNPASSFFPQKKEIAITKDNIEKMTELRQRTLPFFDDLLDLIDDMRDDFTQNGKQAQVHGRVIRSLISCIHNALEQEF